MYRKKILLFPIIGIGLAAGCGTTSGSAMDPSHGGVLVSGATDSGPAQGPSQVQQIPLSSLPAPSQPLPVLSARQTTGLCTMPWHLVTVENDERRIVMVVAADPRVIKGVRIDQTPEHVSIAMYRVPPSTGPSTAVSIHATVLVELPDALGSRRLLGASSGACP
jgi:hypothetical protein